MPVDSLFDVAMGCIFKWEGGLSDHPKDPGGITKYGICLRSYPRLGRDGIIALTKDDAKEIYRKDYWPTVPEWLQDTHGATCIVLMDCAVNQGPSFARNAIQRACGAADDGIIGPETKRKALAVPDLELANSLCVQRALHYASLRTFDTFGKGWMNRLFDVHATATLYACYTVLK